MYEQEKQVEALEVEREQRLRDVAEQEERELRSLRLSGATQDELGRRRATFAGRRAAIVDHYTRELAALREQHAAQPGILGPAEPLDAALRGWGAALGGAPSRNSGPRRGVPTSGSGS